MYNHLIIAPSFPMKKIVQEMTRMKDERNRLRMIMAQYMAEDLASFSAQDLSNLEQQIEFSLYKVRLRKVTMH
jgi:hypothetical protein